MRRRPVRPEAVRARLARLRENCEYLQLHARLGCELREMIAAAGSPTWMPAEDTTWRSWIEHQGDEYARMMLQAIDDELEARVARIEAGEEEVPE